MRRLFAFQIPWTQDSSARKNVSLVPQWKKVNDWLIGSQEGKHTP